MALRRYCTSCQYVGAQGNDLDDIISGWVDKLRDESRRQVYLCACERGNQARLDLRESCCIRCGRRQAMSLGESCPGVVLYDCLMDARLKEGLPDSVAGDIPITRPQHRLRIILACVPRSAQ
jgi:hypothetical protein